MGALEEIPIPYRRFFERKPEPLVEKFLAALREYADSARNVLGFYGICECGDGGKGPTIETLLSLEAWEARRVPGRQILSQTFPLVGLVEVSLKDGTRRGHTEVLAAYFAICHECARSRLWVQLPMGIPRFGLPASQVLSRRQFHRFGTRL